MQVYVTKDKDGKAEIMLSGKWNKEDKKELSRKVSSEIVQTAKQVELVEDPEDRPSFDGSQKEVTSLVEKGLRVGTIFIDSLQKEWKPALAA